MSNLIRTTENAIQSQEFNSALAFVLGQLSDSQKQIISRVKAVEDVAFETQKEISEFREVKEDRIPKLEKHVQNLAHNMTRFNEERHSGKYVNRTVLGRRNLHNISAQRITKLLRYAGILTNDRNTKGEPEPRHEYFKGLEPIAIKKPISTKDGYETYQILYHYDLTWRKIDKKLSQEKFYDAFTECKNANEVEGLIDFLSMQKNQNFFGGSYD